MAYSNMIISGAFLCATWWFARRWRMRRDFRRQLERFLGAESLRLVAVEKETMAFVDCGSPREAMLSSFQFFRVTADGAEGRKKLLLMACHRLRSGKLKRVEVWSDAKVEK